MQDTMMQTREVQSTMPTQIGEQVARLLLKEKAVIIDTNNLVQFVSGILSPVYVDNRKLISCSTTRRTIVSSFIRILMSQIGETNFDVIAGTATAGIPWSAWIADELDLPMIYVRPTPKDRGMKKQVEGILRQGQRAIVVEDLITTGLSSASATEAIRAIGGVVTHCVAIFSFDAPASYKRFREHNVTPWALTNLATLLNTAKREEYLSNQDVIAVKHWAATTLASYEYGISVK